MKRIILILGFILMFSFTALAQTKPAEKATGNKAETAKEKVEPSKDIVVLEEDASLIERAYQILSDKKKDYDLALEQATRVEADAAANSGVSRKTHQLIRDEEGKLVFRVRPPAPPAPPIK